VNFKSIQGRRGFGDTWLTFPAVNRPFLPYTTYLYPQNYSCGTTADRSIVGYYIYCHWPWRDMHSIHVYTLSLGLLQLSFKLYYRPLKERTLTHSHSFESRIRKYWRSQRHCQDLFVKIQHTFCFIPITQWNSPDCLSHTLEKQLDCVQ